SSIRYQLDAHCSNYQATGAQWLAVIAAHVQPEVTEVIQAWFHTWCPNETAVVQAPWDASLPIPIVNRAPLKSPAHEQYPASTTIGSAINNRQSVGEAIQPVRTFAQ